MGAIVMILTIGAPWIRRRWFAWRDRHVAERQAEALRAPLG